MGWFLSFLFWGILSLRQVCFFEISIKFSIFWYPIRPFSRKKISLQKGRLSDFWHKNRKQEKHHKVKKNAFSKIVLDIFCQSKTTWSIVNLKNHWTLVESGQWTMEQWTMEHWTWKIRHAHGNRYGHGHNTDGFNLLH